MQHTSKLKDDLSQVHCPIPRQLWVRGVAAAWWRGHSGQAEGGRLVQGNTPQVTSTEKIIKIEIQNLTHRWQAQFRTKREKYFFRTGKTGLFPASFVEKIWKRINESSFVIMETVLMSK